MVDFTPPAERDLDAWQVQIWNLPEEEVSRPQKLQFMLMLEARFNAFDPYRVVTDLLRHRHLWQGAVMDRAHLHPGGEEGNPRRLNSDLIKLRDIEAGYWNVDSLFLLTEHAEKLCALAEEWAADEVHVIDCEEASRLLGTGRPGQRLKVVTVWWD
jgi:hypothetical protein